ncbi:unnamed protein product [Malus baccata var. baccata]
MITGIKPCLTNFKLFNPQTLGLLYPHLLIKTWSDANGFSGSKRKPNGSIDWYKARLVAKGFHQQEGIDFKETFSPVAKPVTIRILLTMAVQYDWFLHQLDISNAFLNGNLQEDVFMQQPPVKDLGPLHYFLGLKVHRSDEGIFLSQSKYALDLLVKTSMAGCKPYPTPLGTQKLDHTGALLADPKEYRSIVGALQYLTWTRPDLSFAVNQACQFLHCPRDSHFQAVKRILRFLKGTFDQGMWFKKSPLHLTAYSDADWARYVLDRRFTSGYCIYLGRNLISWSAKKQHTVARSSTEDEYRSLAHTAAELTWICKIFRDVAFQLTTIPTLWCDNVSAISLASNPVFHARAKHVEIDYHYIRELVIAKLLQV